MRRDRFPALVIWASLRILTRHPHLRQQFGERPDRPGSALLWSSDDLLHPAGSPLFATLDGLGDATLRPLLEIVRRAIRFSPDETPPLSEISERLETLGFPKLASTPGKLVRRISAPAERRRRAVATPVAPAVETPIEQTPAAISMGDDLAAKAPAVDRPEPPRPDRKRSELLLRELESALASRDARSVLQAWDGVRQFDEASPFAPAVHDVLQREVAPRLTGRIAAGMTRRCWPGWRRQSAPGLRRRRQFGPRAARPGSASPPRRSLPGPSTATITNRWRG